MKFILLHLDSSSSSSDEKLFEEIALDDWIVLQVTITCVNIGEYFTSAELDEKNGQSINPNEGVWEIMQATTCLFKCLTKFTLGEFEELVQLVVPTIISHARSTREPHHTIGRPSKLALKQHLFSFILFMKRDNVTKYDAFMWNWNKSAINDNDIFIVYCTNFTISNKIHWPIV
jgi:hypothetical protein